MLRLFVFIICILASSASWAQDGRIGVQTEAEEKAANQSQTPTLMLRKNQPTHPERILMAFYKVAGLQPDFLKWAEKSPFLKDAKAIDTNTITSRENNRMSQAFTELDATEPLVVEIKIRLDNYSTLQEVLKLSEFTPKTFFSYSLYDESVAIVPKDIANFGTIKISKVEMDEILEKSRGAEVTAELLLKPVVGDAKTPFVQGKQSYWLLLAEIGEIRFWSSGAEPKLLWMHRADWFKPKEDKTLMNLKSGMGGM